MDNGGIMATDRALYADDAPPVHDEAIVPVRLDSHLERIRAPPALGHRVRTALRMRHGIDGCVDALQTLANRLRDDRMGGLERTRAAPAHAQESVAACVARLQSLKIQLEESLRLGHHLDNELLLARRTLQRMREDLLRTEMRCKHASHAALHDPLTGLPNRSSFEERSRHALALHGSRARAFSVVYIDLDGFKAINDAHGHAIGDRVLKVIGRRLMHAVRAEDSITRHGGDEFACLLLDIQSETHVTSIAHKLFDAISAPCMLGTLTLHVRASVGVALYPRDGATVEALLQSADTAMFWAKKHRLGHAFFSHVPTDRLSKPTASG